MYRIGLSTCGKKVDEQLFADYARSGISDMELSEVSYAQFDYKNTEALAKEYGVSLWSMHLPFVPFANIEISALDKQARTSTIALLSDIIRRGADIGIDKFIIHPSGEPIEDSIRAERMKNASESLVQLADIAERNGAVICVEDLPRTCLGHSIEEMKQLLSTDARLRMCYDTNHVTKDRPEDILRALGDKIVTLHVSDFDFVDERHWLPGEGKIDWKTVLELLGQIEYKGSFMYEIAFACPKTIVRDRALTTDDFVRNAKELFEGKPLTVLATEKLV